MSCCGGHCESAGAVAVVCTNPDGCSLGAYGDRDEGEVYILPIELALMVESRDGFEFPENLEDQEVEHG